jgi:hypothetical protein
LIAICRFVDADGIAFPSQPTIASLAGITSSTNVATAILALERSGYIERVGWHLWGRGKRSRKYRVRYDAPTSEQMTQSAQMTPSGEMTSCGTDREVIPPHAADPIPPDDQTAHRTSQRTAQAPQPVARTPAVEIADGFVRFREIYWPGSKKPLQIPATLAKGAQRFIDMGGTVDVVLQHLENAMATNAEAGTEAPYSLEAFHKSLARKIREHEHAGDPRPGDQPDRQEPGMTAAPRPTNGLSEEDDTRRIRLMALLMKNVWLPSWRGPEPTKEAAQAELDALMAKGRQKLEGGRQKPEGEAP